MAHAHPFKILRSTSNVIHGFIDLLSIRTHLIYLNNFQMLDILERYIQSEKFPYSRLDGGSSIGGRQALVKKFNEVIISV